MILPSCNVFSAFKKCLKHSILKRNLLHKNNGVSTYNAMLSAKREDELFVPTSLSHGDGLSVIDKFNTQQRPTNCALSVHRGFLCEGN